MPAAAGYADDLERRAWRAQVGVILPWIDERRIEICSGLQCLGMCGDGNARTPAALDALGVEIGELKRRFDVDADLARELGGIRQLVSWLHHARNEVAHIRRLLPSDITRGQELDRDGQ